MVICPECGYPYEDDTRVISERQVTCANCRWSGSSSKLLQVKGELRGGVDVLQQLYLFLGRNVAPQIGVKMMELGLLNPAKDSDNVTKIALVLSAISRASFKAVLESIVEEENEGARVSN